MSYNFTKIRLKTNPWWISVIGKQMEEEEEASQVEITSGSTLPHKYYIDQESVLGSASSA